MVNRFAVKVTTGLMLYFIVAGSSGLLLWLLQILRLVIKYEPFTSAKPGWGWVVYLHVWIQKPRYAYLALWQEHPVLTVVATYLVAMCVFIAMNYSATDREATEEQLLQKLSEG